MNMKIDKNGLIVPEKLTLEDVNLAMREGVVQLTCANEEGFLNGGLYTDRGWREVVLSLDKIIVDSISPCEKKIFLRDARGTHIKFSELEHFCILSSAPNFDDLFFTLYDLAVKAAREGKLYFRFLSSEQISFSDDNGEKRKFNILKGSCDHKDLQEAIDFINSLHTETFVIVTEDDCKRIKRKAKIIFLNGNSVVMDNPPCDSGIVRIWNDGRYDFTVLQGATVIQSVEYR